MKKIVGYGQLDTKFGDVETNLRSLEKMVQSTRADLLVFPELGLTGYDFNNAEEVREYAEPFETGPTSEALRRLSAESGTTIVLGYPESTSSGCYNSCMLATPHGELHNYRKAHLYSRENLLFLPGDAPPPVVETPSGRIGLMICFDWFFPEMARILALRGAQIIAHPSNLILPYGQRAMFARCIENQVFAITANRIGTESRAGRTLTFTGESQVLDPKGTRLVSAPVDGEHLGVTEIDPELADNKAINEFNDLFENRRLDLYEDVLDPHLNRSSTNTMKFEL